MKGRTQLTPTRVLADPEPIQTFAVGHPYLIRDGRNPQNDIRLTDESVELMAVSMASANVAKKFQVSKSFPSGSKYEDIFNATAHRLCEASIAGFNSTLICLGGSNHGKEELFVGGATGAAKMQKGLVEHAFEDLWDLLESSLSHFKQEDRQYQFTVEISCFEIYDEKIRDLLTSGDVDLPIVNDPILGFIVGGLSVHPVASTAAAMDVFNRSKLARQSNMGDYDSVPPLHDATYLLQARIVQQLGPKNGNDSAVAPELIESRLCLCEVAGTEALLQSKDGASSQRKKTLAQSVRALNTVAQQLSAANDRSGKTSTPETAKSGSIPKLWQGDFADFTQSALTKVLQDALGGNAVTVCIASLMQGGAECNGATMHLLDCLRQVKCYPVPHSSRMLELMRRMRTNIVHLQEQLDAFRLLGESANGEDAIADKNASALQIAKLNEKSLDLQIRLKQMQESRDSVHRDLEKMRANYEELVQKKSDMQTEFIQTEEEKLHVSKALLDLQIENNQLKERLDRGQYDVDSKMLTVEHDLIEMQVERDALKEKQQTMEADLKEAAIELRDLQEEYITLRTNYINLTQEFNNAKKKAESVNAEFLSLVNKCNILEKTNVDLEREREGLTKEAETSKRAASVLEIENSKAVDEARELRAAVIKLEAQKLNFESKLKAQEVKFNEEHLRLEKESASKNLAQEGEMLSRQRGIQHEQSRFTTELTLMQKKVNDIQSKLRMSERKCRVAAKALEDSNRECSKWKHKYDESEKTLSERTANYQRQLVRYVVGNDTQNQWYREVGQHLFTSHKQPATLLLEDGDKSQSKTQSLISIDDDSSIPGRAVHEMVQVHEHTIARAEGKARHAEEEAETFGRNAIALRRAYTELYEQVKDLDPELGIKIPPLEDTLRATASSERILTEDGEKVQRAMNRQEGEIRKLTLALEQECSARAEEGARFVRERQQLQEKIKLMEAKLEAGGGGDHASVSAPEVKKLMDLQKQLLEKLDELQQRKPSEKAELDSKQAAKDPSPEKAPKKPKRKAKSKRKKNVAEESGEKPAKFDEWKSKALALEEKHRVLQSEYDSLLDRLEKGLVKEGKGDLSKAIRSAEERAAKGMTKFTMAEAELKNYKQFMAKTIKNYNKKISSLRAQLKK